MPKSQKDQQAPAADPGAPQETADQRQAALDAVTAQGQDAGSGARADAAPPGATGLEPAAATTEPDHNVPSTTVAEDELATRHRVTVATHGQAGISDTLPPSTVEEPGGDPRAVLPANAGAPPAEEGATAKTGSVNSRAATTNDPGFEQMVALYPPTGMQPGIDPTPLPVEELSIEERLRGGYGYPPGYTGRRPA